MRRDARLKYSGRKNPGTFFGRIRACRNIFWKYSSEKLKQQMYSTELLMYLQSTKFCDISNERWSNLERSIILKVDSYLYYVSM